MKESFYGTFGNSTCIEYLVYKLTTKNVFDLFKNKEDDITTLCFLSSSLELTHFKCGEVRCLRFEVRTPTPIYNMQYPY